MGCCKKIISIFLAFAIVFFSEVPAQAAGELVPISGGGAGDGGASVVPITIDLNDFLIHVHDNNKEFVEKMHGSSTEIKGYRNYKGMAAAGV